MVFKIFQLLGTPTEQTWPGVHALPDFSSAFPKWPRQLLTKKCRELDDAGADLLQVRACGRVCMSCSVLCVIVLVLSRNWLLIVFSFLVPRSAQMLLKYNPATRVSAKVALQHPFFERLKA